MAPVVSVVMPCYNYGRYVEGAVRSVLAQSLQDLELLVVDDGSTDHTAAVLANIHDDRLIVTTIANAGVSAARNHALERARGEFVAFLDADDLWHVDKLAAQVATLRDFPNAGFAFCNFRRFNNDGTRMADQFQFAPELRALPSRPAPSAKFGHLLIGAALPNLLQLSDMPWYPTANVLRRSAIGSIRFDTKRRIAEDVAFFARVWARSDAVYVDDILCELRRHDSNASATLSRRHELNLIDVFSELDTELTSADARAAVQRRIGREWANLGYHHYHRAELGSAGRAYLRALRFRGSRRTALVHLATLPLAIRHRPASHTTP